MPRKIVTVTITLEIEQSRNPKNIDPQSAVERILDRGELQDAINALGVRVISAVQS